MQLKILVQNPHTLGDALQKGQLGVLCILQQCVLHLLVVLDLSQAEPPARLSLEHPEICILMVCKTVWQHPRTLWKGMASARNLGVPKVDSVLPGLL